MRRRGSRLNKKEHPFEIDTNASFLIKNETTLEERLFSYAEVIDGTYDTWLSGANGGVLEWRGSTGSTLFSGATTYIRLISNGGNPYLNDWEQNANLGVQRTVNMSQDWVITCILDKELLSSIQRLNIGVRGTGSNLFALQLSGGDAFVIYDRLTGSTGEADFSFTYPYTDVFKVFTFVKIGGIVKAYVNDLEKTKGALSAYTITEQIMENTIVLGSRSYPNSSSGKVTNYKHLKVLTGDLSGFDLSAHNNAIMTKYGIV